MVLGSKVSRHDLGVCLKTAKQKPISTQTSQPQLWFSSVSYRELVQTLPISGMPRWFKGQRAGCSSLCHEHGHEFLLALTLHPHLLPPTAPWPTADIPWPSLSTAPHCILLQAFAQVLPLPWIPFLHCLARLALFLLIYSNKFSPTHGLGQYPTSSSHYMLHNKHLLSAFCCRAVC